MKVIFLDIDGVLNIYCQDRDKFGCTFHDHLVDNLESIIEKTGAKIVISSSWRLDGKDAMMEMWKSRNLPGEVIDITPNLSYGAGLNTGTPRGKEIQEWLDNHPDVTNYVIIDDDVDMLPEQLSNFVVTAGNTDHEDCVDLGYGLTKKCAELAISILNKDKSREIEKYLIQVGIRSLEYNYKEEDIFNNIDYFKRCFENDLSAYKALLFFNDYLDGNVDI